MRCNTYLLNPDYSLKRRGKELFLVDKNGKEASPLNETAYAILKCADGRQTKDRIAAALFKKYQGNKREIAVAVETFLNKQTGRGLVIKGEYQEQNRCFLEDNFRLPPGRSFIPKDVCFGITGKCNLRCRHCIARDTWEAEDIPTRKMLEVIDQLGRAGASHVSIFGGEPLVRGDLFLLLERFRKYPVSLGMNTNATLMDPGTAHTLVDRFKIRGYTVSLDGTRDIHERQRGKGTYDTAVEGIEHILRAGGKPVLSFTVTRLNIEDLEKTAALGKELGMCQVRFNHVFYGGNATCYLDDVQVSPREELDALQRVYELSRKYPGFITGSYLQQYEKMQRVGKEKPVAGFVRVPPCGAGTIKCTIRPDGWITPCEVLWSVKAGNIKKQAFNAVWKKSETMKAFRKTLYVDVARLPGCADCEYQFICFWGHRCSPYHYPGGIQNRSLYCWKMK